MSLNKVQIMGRFVRDPELRTTPNQVNVVNFTLAVDRDSTSENKKTDFIDVVAWRGAAEFIDRNFRKGMKAVVAGSLQVRDWKDKNGNSRRSTEVVLENIYFCDKKQSADGENVWTEESMSREEYDSLFEDVNQDSDMPF